MTNPEPTNTTRIVRDTFVDMALYLECLFLLHGVNDILVEDIIHCVEDGYAKTMKNLRKHEVAPLNPSEEVTAGRIRQSEGDAK